MRLKGKEYSKRLEEYSHDTILLISRILYLQREALDKGMDILTNSELNEEQVAEELKALLKENNTTHSP